MAVPPLGSLSGIDLTDGTVTRAWRDSETIWPKYHGSTRIVSSLFAPEILPWALIHSGHY